MATAIREELARDTERIIVVTGGFHSVVLPQLVNATARPAPSQAKRKEEVTLDCLIRYSFEQLDALNGYAAGMPSPYYYDQLWHAVAQVNVPEAFAISRRKST